MKTNITPDRKRLSHEEWDAVIGLEAVHSVLVSKNTMPVLQKRIKEIKYGARDAAMLTNALGRLLKALYNNVPYEQLKSLSNNLAMSELHVGIKTTRKHSMTDYGMLISWEQLEVLGTAAMEKCVVCNLSTQEQRQCPLKKILDEMPGAKYEHGKGCGYYGL